jgi:hypothetical protein
VPTRNQHISAPDVSALARPLPSREQCDAIPFRDRVSCTVDVALQASGLGKTFLYQQISKGRLKSVKVGRRRLVDVKSLLELLEMGGCEERNGFDE